MTKKRLGEMLLEAGVIDETQLQAALGHQRKWGGKLGQALLDLKLATEPQIVSALSRKFGYEVVNVSTLPRTAAVEAAMKLVPRELALRQMLLPIAADSNSVTVAMADPSNIAVVDELSFRTGRRIKIALAGDREIAAAVRRLYFADEAPAAVSAIPLDDPSNTGLPIEVTKDPFAAMPDYVREGYFKRPAHTLADQPAGRQAPAFQPPAPPMPTAYSRPAAMPATAPAYAPRGAVPARPLAPQAPELGEPILATELAPADLIEGPFEAPAPPRPPVMPVPPMAPVAPLQPQVRQAPLLDLLDRMARGEDTGGRAAGRLAAAVARVLLRRGLISEQELLEELARKP